MRPFTFEHADSLAQAARLNPGIGQGQTDPSVQFLAGGTTLLDLMKLDVLKPERVVDLGPLRRKYDFIDAGPHGLYLGAFATMATVASHRGVLDGYPVIAESLQLAASAQIRNMATLGGNILQRTRCAYYRDRSWDACNKRNPGSGCAAIKGVNRNHAVLGVDASCISQYPGDFAVALVALDAQLELSGPQGSRRMPFSALHTPPDGRPHIETTMLPGELITAIFIAHGAWNRRSTYLKLRDRTSYEFAISSAAVALDLADDRVRNVRIGLGGMAYRPWRSVEAERVLIGGLLTEATAEMAAVEALKSAQTNGHNDYKPALARQTLVRALLQASSMTLEGAPVQA